MKSTEILKKEIRDFAEELKDKQQFYKSIYEGSLDIQTLSVLLQVFII